MPLGWGVLGEGSRENSLLSCRLISERNKKAKSVMNISHAEDGCLGAKGADITAKKLHTETNALFRGHHKKVIKYVNCG